jgi:hypothetical protein
MGWSIGYDERWKRDIGYGVPAECDHPDCREQINRGLSYVCADQVPYGGDGCGLFFCETHRGHELPSDASDYSSDCCERCAKGEESFDAKPDVREWIEWKLTDASWQQWRDENPAEVAKLRATDEVTDG